jgi:signal transduction histidine kinase
VSLILSFIITFFLFQKQVTQIRETEIITQGKGIIDLYQRLDQKGFKEYLKSLSTLPYEVYLFNQDGLVVKSPQAPNNSEFSKKTINDVINGDVYRNMAGGSHHMSIGLPFETKKGRYALFIKPSLKEQFSQIRNILFTALLIVLFLGISLILVTTRFLVKPIVRVTNATNELANGNFHIRLDVKSKDEIGQLAKSFNFMVGELDKTEQMRKDFVANVSHELQSPLTAIKGMAIALKDGAVDPACEKHYFEQIEQESERLSSLTKQLLNLSILEANKSPFHPTIYRLDRQMRNQLVAMQSLWTEKQLEIDFDIPKLEVFADEGLMNQVWTNLYSNAIKYNWPNGKITVRGYEYETTVDVAISNTGRGIPKVDLPYIFERFYRVEKAHSRATESYGLGLAVVKRIIDLHNGEISVESIEGQETTFKIRVAKNKSD